MDGQGTSRVVTPGQTNTVLTDRSTGALQLLVRSMDPDTRIHGGLQRLQVGGHCSSVLRPRQSIRLGKQVGSSHHIVQMEGLGGGRAQKSERVSLEQRTGSLCPLLTHPTSS
jgi:hypothetical protein